MKIPALVFAMLLAGGAAQAATIIDLNGRTDSVLSPVGVALTAGKYSVTPITPADGGLYTSVSYWAISSCVVTTGCPQTSPTTNTGFMYKYDVQSDEIVSASVAGVDLTALSGGPPAGDVFASYWEKTATGNFVRVSEGIVYPTAANGFQSAQAMTFTLGSDSTVSFGIFDTLPSDNRGGISLLLESVSVKPPAPIPLPATLPLMALGIAALAGLGRFRKKRG